MNIMISFLITDHRFLTQMQVPRPSLSTQKLHCLSSVRSMEMSESDVAALLEAARDSFMLYLHCLHFFIVIYARVYGGFN